MHDWGTKISPLEQEKELLTNDIELILITCDREQLRCTLEDKIKTREDRNYDRAQYHLRDIEVGLKKDELYKFYFDKLRFVKKELIVNKGTCLEEFSSDLITVVKNLGVSIS